MTNSLLSLPKDVLSHILVDYAYPESADNFFKAYKQLQPQYQEEVWRLKLKEYFPNRDTLFSSALKEKETYHSRFFEHYEKEKKSYKIKHVPGNPLHQIFVAVHYGDWNERIRLKSLGIKSNDNNLLIADLYRNILSRAVYKAAPSKEIAWIDSMKNQRILDKCFSFLYDDIDYRKALKTVHKNCEDVELFVQYNQISRIKELIMQKDGHNEKIDLANKIFTISLKNPNEMQFQLINKFIKDDPLMNTSPSEATPTLYQLQLGQFLEIESEDHFEWVYPRLIKAIEKKQEETALILIKLISFKDKSIPNFKEILFVKAVESKMQTVIDAIFNKFPLENELQMYASLFSIAITDSSIMECFLDKIRFILGFNRLLELKVFASLVSKAKENRSNPELFRKFAYAVSSFYSFFEKEPLPKDLLKKEVLKEEKPKKINTHYDILYLLALSIQDMGFFEKVRKKNPLNWDNVEHKQIIRLLVSETPFLAGQIDAIKITNQNTQDQYHQPYIWTLGNQQVDTIDRYTLTNNQTLSILSVKPGDTLNYQKMINILLTDSPLQLEELIHSKDEGGNTIYKNWEQFLKINCRCRTYEIIPPQIAQLKKKQKLK
jgi:hypothetical protein